MEVNQQRNLGVITIGNHPCLWHQNKQYQVSQMVILDEFDWFWLEHFIVTAISITKQKKPIIHLLKNKPNELQSSVTKSTFLLGPRLITCIRNNKFIEVTASLANSL